MPPLGGVHSCGGHIEEQVSLRQESLTFRYWDTERILGNWC
jgi:hypothetical protein